MLLKTDMLELWLGRGQIMMGLAVLLMLHLGSTRLFTLYPEYIKIDISGYDKPPKIKQFVKSVPVNINSEPLINYIDLKQIFYDEEDDNTNLSYKFKNTNHDLCASTNRR